VEVGQTITEEESLSYRLKKNGNKERIGNYDKKRSPANRKKGDANRRRGPGLSRIICMHCGRSARGAQGEDLKGVQRELVQKPGCQLENIGLKRI